MKTCSRCKEEKEVKEFYLCKITVDGYSSWCKICTKRQAKLSSIECKDRILQRKIDFPWVQHWYNARRRCRDKNMKCAYLYVEKGIKCLITKEEMKELWFRDEAYRMINPSIDRKDSDNNYSLNNCRFVEMSINSSFAHIRPILQLNLNGKLIKEYKSIADANRNIRQNPYNSSIRLCCKGRRKTAFKFMWKYKEI